MPRGDRTGPLGQGPMTGRRMGDCAETENVGSGFGYGRGFFSRGRGYGYGRGFGFGYGRRFGFFGRVDEPVADEEAIKGEINLTKNRLSFLESLLRKNKSEE